ncbi:Chloroperoxidase [Microdochium trichocladiopsis]|uniref:Chloroperoxidase n=1 Tax=Microdochium trichocladiopsis TaxID=1682393 RepID=A0A9P9BLN6_9PEZI|nr:Chloroperoxidase [Microdochium trichocladiopsis]KAH7014282.1 Chloroperoxidase [Microdochium trichocladiopsis]
MVSVVDGVHEFRPPNFAQGDQRGPCPGLNALANHGYLSRDGVVGFLEAIDAINSVFGMGIDLATVIAAMGVTTTGNPLSLNPGFSIGGQSAKSQNLLGNLLGLLGTPRGLEGSHNFIEADSSNTRDDLYVTGDASTMNMKYFMDVYNSIPAGGFLSVEAMGDRAAKRLAESKATNPLFYYGPYTGLIVRNAGFLFGIRLLSNHTDEYPLGGHMDRETFKSLWGVTTLPDGTLKYNKGWERIPANWYRTRSDYGFVELNLDLLSWIAKHPELASIGGNMGTTNSFTPVDLANLSGGVFNVDTMLQGNNLMCFTLEIVKAFAPNSLSSLFTTLAKPLQMITDAVAVPLLNLGCPAMHELEANGSNILAGLLSKFPGAQKSGSAL